MDSMFLSFQASPRENFGYFFYLRMRGMHVTVYQEMGGVHGERLQLILLVLPWDRERPRPHEQATAEK